MTADETTPMTPELVAAGPDAAETAPEFLKVGPLIAAKIGGDDVQANLSAIGSAVAGSLSATGSLIGMASVDGDATITASMTPAVITKGATTVQQSYASAVIVGGGANTTVHQAATPLIIGKTMDISQSGAGMLVTGEADVKKSWVGIVLAPKTTISDDSRVFISTKAALIIALALFGGFGLVALAIALSAQRLMHWKPTLSIPALNKVQEFPDFATLQERFRQMAARHRAA